MKIPVVWLVDNNYCYSKWLSCKYANESSLNGLWTQNFPAICMNKSEGFFHFKERYEYEQEKSGLGETIVWIKLNKTDGRNL